MDVTPQEVWQELFPPGRLAPGPQPGGEIYAAGLPDGRTILQPIRVLPGGSDRGVASLILNQASFVVLDALAAVVADRAALLAPEIVVAVPTLGLPLAEAVARRLGHARMVALSTSRKFWYDDAMSQPLRSITTPDQAKRIWIDPRMLPLLEGRRVLLVDDVFSTGSSVASVLRLLDSAGVRPVAAACAMLQGLGWRSRISEAAPGLPVIGAFHTPILIRDGAGLWHAEDQTA